VAVVGEWINACSTKLEPTEIAALTENGEVPIEGVFRIWFEWAGGKDDVLSEENEVGPYSDSNPKHAIEIDPVVLVGQRQFYDTVRAMEWFDFNVHGMPALQRLLKRKVTIDGYDADDGTSYVAIESGGSLPNHFQLKSRPEVETDEDRGRLLGRDRYHGQAEDRCAWHPGVHDRRYEGQRFAQKLEEECEFSFWGITRLDGKKALKALEDDAGYHIPIPLEFVLLDIHK
jgi:hypothetical protein